VVVLVELLIDAMLSFLRGMTTPLPPSPERENVGVKSVPKLSFLTGRMTLLPPSPKRENAGVASVTDIRFSVGSREIEGGRGWLGKPGIDGGTVRGIG
jgi:hypothetical protein